MGSLYKTPVETRVRGTLSKTVVSKSFKTVVPGVYKLRNRKERKGKYLASIWSGFPGDVSTALMVWTTLSTSV
jgi:hypothetical protein